ncbi:hypothetical protein BU15DRAFT_87912 [Melanogaster broomeanus]|nr:hypothetical protein BU15DRAFT_87912 [Melanogaster broomeanus]
MSEQERKELDAFFAFFATFDLARPVTTVSDLSDGAALIEILSLVDVDYFRQSSRATPQLSDNWVLRFTALKRLYRLLTQYFADVLQKPTSGLEVPDLQAIAKDHSLTATLIMCRMTIAISVQCEKNKEIIERIQKLNEESQHHLMKAIEQAGSEVSDDHYYRIQSERSQILGEKETVEKVYQILLEEHPQRDLESRRNDKADIMMRAEIDRLRSELQKSEDNLAMAEAELDKQTSVVGELTHKIGELQVKANHAAVLKDQTGLQKTENVMEKYKKKLQEGADLRQHVKNASLEEEYRKVAAFKPLMESYKNQIADLESKVSTRTQELETVKFELEQTRTKLRITTEERTKDSEMLELYQERMREMELDDAISGTTMTDLKLQLSAVKKNEVDGSRILVLENLLEDANRMKSRYEADYLAAHREKLEIRSGKALGDGAEAAIALRQRLNETVDQLDALRKEHADLEVQFDTQNRELTIAKSDLNLVNKDQVDILASLRESVREDNTALEIEMERLKKQIKELSDKNRMQLEQVNVLLLEKEKMLQRERDFGDLRMSLSGKDVPEDVKARLLALHEENLNVKEQLKTSQEKLTKTRTFIKTQDKLLKEEQAKLASLSNVGQNSFEEAEGSFQTQIKNLNEELARANVRILLHIAWSWRNDTNSNFTAWVGSYITMACSVSGVRIHNRRRRENRNLPLG